MTSLMHLDFSQALIVVLIGGLFFKDEMKQILFSKFGVKTSVPPTEGKMDRLLQHFNHDTTALLTEIRDDLKENNKTTSTVLTKVEEMIKYGVPERK